MKGAASDEDAMAYVGRKLCGCIVAVVVDRPEWRRETAQSVASLIREGYEVDRVTVQESREIVARCPHGEES